MFCADVRLVGSWKFTTFLGVGALAPGTRVKMQCFTSDETVMSITEDELHFLMHGKTLV